LREERAGKLRPLTLVRVRVEYLVRESETCFSVLRKVCSYRYLLEELLYPGEAFTTPIEELCIRIESAEKLSRGNCTDLKHSCEDLDKAFRALQRILRDLDSPRIRSEARSLSRSLVEVSEVCVEDLRRTLREVYRYKCWENHNHHKSGWQKTYTQP